MQPVGWRNNSHARLGLLACPNRASLLDSGNLIIHRTAATTAIAPHCGHCFMLQAPHHLDPPPHSPLHDPPRHHPPLCLDGSSDEPRSHAVYASGAPTKTAVGLTRSARTSSTRTNHTHTATTHTRAKQHTQMFVGCNNTYQHIWWRPQPDKRTIMQQAADLQLPLAGIGAHKVISIRCSMHQTVIRQGRRRSLAPAHNMTPSVHAVWCSQRGCSQRGYNQGPLL